MSSEIACTGHWIRWADGPVLGSTLTLTSRNGGFLVAFLAVFVSFVGRYFWAILKFLIHQWRAQRQPKDALHHQQQVILRNSTSAAAALWLWLKTAWAWRSQTSRPIRRSIALVLIAFVNVAAFTVAGIFSSHVTSTTNLVLLQNQTCGSWRWRTVESLDPIENLGVKFKDFLILIPAWSAYYTELLRRSRQDVTYVRSCYNGTQNSLSPDCQQYATQQIPYATEENVPCPFDIDLCMSPAIQTMSDPIFSDTDLGINTAKADRVAYRRKMTCSVLSTERYTSSFVTPLLPGDTDVDGAYPYSNNTYFYYGPSVRPAALPAANYTIYYSNYSNSRAVQLDNGYHIGCLSSMLTRLNSFSPITALKPTDGDIDVCFLGLTAVFPKPVNDPWFSAHTPKKLDNATIYFTADRPLSPLGCVTQHQFCNPNLPASSNCTSWSSIAQIPSAIKSLNYGPSQSAVQALVYQAAWNTSFDVVDVLGNEALLASQAFSAAAAPLPPNQWVLEVKNLHATMLASMQSLMLARVSGPANSDFRQYMDPASTEDEQTLCTSQIATRNDYASFSTFGVAMILALGGVIIIIGLSLESITSSIRKSRNRGTHRQLEWDVSEVLQLQRLAYEGQGKGNWRGGVDSVPTTAREDRFGIPSWSDKGEEKEDAMKAGSDDSPLIPARRSRLRAASTAPLPT